MIEFLPLFSGAVITILVLFIKPAIIKTVSVFLLPVIIGISVNMLNEEGIGLMVVDIFVSFISTLTFMGLAKYIGLLTVRDNRICSDF